MSDAKILSFSDIKKISLKELINNRELQRDIAYTVAKSLTSEEKRSAIHRLSREKGHAHRESIREVINRQLNPNSKDKFKIADSNNIYFFPLYTSEADKALLIEEDFIDSGFSIGVEDYSDNSKQNALAKLIQQDASFIASPFGLDSKGRLDLGNHKPTIIKINDLPTLESALYAKYHPALRALDLMPAFFKQPVHRENTRGEKEAYSSKQKRWIDRTNF